MKGAIAFSLFGTDPMYSLGAVRNAELAPKIYPGWKTIFYCDRDVTNNILTNIKKAGGEIRPGVEGINNQLFWRFCAIDDKQFTHVIVRDTDSRLNPREKAAVDEWIESGLNAHSMHDHPLHSAPMGGGLFGLKTGILKIRELIAKTGVGQIKYSREKQYDVDQMWLAHVVHPLVRNKLLRHSSCNRHIYRDAIPFPDGCKFGADRFVGEIIDAYDRPHPWHYQMRINYQTV